MANGHVSVPKLVVKGDPKDPGRSSSSSTGVRCAMPKVHGDNVCHLLEALSLSHGGNPGRLPGDRTWSLATIRLATLYYRACHLVP
jgi:hypothetical protein